MAEVLEATDESFTAFYRELHATDPYLWQRRAAVELASGQSIWRTLQVPTGAGKTTLVECFLFALGCACGHKPRGFPVRLYWVVDRRNVVDQVYAHAFNVASRIATAEPGTVTGQVKERLLELARDTTDGEPVQTRLWRGGLPGEASVEIRSAEGGDSSPSESVALSADRLRAPLSPCAAAIVCSTVDQVGSRMLFRGYGVSRRSRPIEAALVSTDSLIVLDEAHLSEPFCETAERVAATQRGELAMPSLQVLPISATRKSGPHELPFELNPEERSDPLLAQRLNARKPVDLMHTRSPIHACHAAGLALAQDGAGVVGVVANTVAAARAMASALQQHGEVVLIVGPSRPLDRADLLARIPDRRERGERETPLFVVGTQTLEVGLDLDFDALVSQCAPLNSLIQRLGRLDRAGALHAEGRSGRGVIVQPPKSCPVYGEMTMATWRLLEELEQQHALDLGPEAATRLAEEAPHEARESDRAQAPILGPWHIAAFEQTSHPPSPDPDVAVFLRGEQALDPPDVQICWRADLLLDSPDDWPRRLRARPPHPGELLSLPWRSARRWLTGALGADALADIEAFPLHGDQVHDEGDASREAVRVLPPGPDGAIEAERISPSDLRPGDVIAVPAVYGGCDEFGWAPQSNRAVGDLGNLAQTRMRVLLSASVGTPQPLLEEVGEVVRLEAQDELSDEEAYERLRTATVDWLTGAEQERSNAVAGRTGAAQRAARRLGHALPAHGRAERLAGGSPLTTAEVLLVPTRGHRERSEPVLYADHAEHVEARMRAFTASLELPVELEETLLRAARYHDLGKLDRRFQTWLNDGEPVEDDRRLAKSGRDPNDRISRRARETANWPEGKRHEVTSEALLASVGAWPTAVDRDLLLHLVATHHGDGRPFRHHASDADDTPLRIELEEAGTDVIVAQAPVNAEVPWPEHARRLVRLSERFGPWGLAALESLLVLADRGASALEAL